MIRVMIVEDDIETAWPMYEAVFSDVADMEITHRFTTMEGVLGVDFSTVDIILMDGTVEMEDDGYDAAFNILSRVPEIPIVLSSYCPDPTMARMAGCCTTWTKSYFQKEELPGLIREFARA